MMDGDYDVPYSLVKHKTLANGKTFEQTLAPYFDEIGLKDIEAGLPLLTMFVPTLPENSFSAELWNTETQMPFVAIRLNTTNDVPVISPEGEIGTIPSHLIPSFPTVVVKNNERMTHSAQPGHKSSRATRSLVAANGSTYKFTDDGFDTELQTKENKKNLRDVLDSQRDQKLHDAYAIYPASSTGWHRDYIYYNITKSNTAGQFLYDFVEYITYFDIVSNDWAVYERISDQINDPNDPEHKEGKKSSGWTDGYFEIRAYTLVQSKNGIGPTVESSHSLLGKQLFTLSYKVSKKGIWPFRYDFYELTGVTSIPQELNIPIVNWDLNNYATTFRIDFEEVDNTTLITEKTIDAIKFASNFEFNIGLGTDVKVGEKFGVSQERTENREVSRQFTLGSDRLGQFLVNFQDKVIIQESVTPYATPDSYARLRDYISGDVLINVEPRRVQ